MEEAGETKDGESGPGVLQGGPADPSLRIGQGTGWLNRADLTDVELRLMDQVEFGGDVDAELPDGTKGGVRSEVLFQILTGAGGSKDVFFQHLRLRNAAIVGQLDLSNCQLLGAATFVDCIFQQGLLLDKAKTRTLTLNNCWLNGGIGADGASIDGDFVLDGCRISVPEDERGTSTALDLLQASITGSLYCTHRFSSQGQVRLVGARIGGRAEFDGTFTNERGNALQLDGASIGGGLYCGTGFIAQGRVSVVGARIGSIAVFNGGRLHNKGGIALNLDSATIGGALFCGDRLHAVGQVRMIGADVGGQAVFDGGRFENPGGEALTLDAASIRGGLACGKGFIAHGQVRMLGAQIGRFANLDGGEFRNEGGEALSMDGASVDGGLFCGADFLAHGWVRLPGVRIAGPLIFGDGDYSRAQIDLAFARADVLDMGVGASPTARLSGFVFDRIQPGLTGGAKGEARVPLEHRLAWLRRDPDHYAPGPYSVLAGAYATAGHEDGAKQVRIASQDARYEQARNGGDRLAGAWGRLKKWTVGYGYRPARAIPCLLLFWALGSVLLGLWWNGKLLWDGFTGEEGTNPFVYFFDLLVPFLDLPQNQAVTATGATVWVVIGIAATGWVLATASIAGITGALTRRE